MNRRVLWLALLLSAIVPISQADASHIFFRDVKINGVLLETSGGFTNPTITVNLGQNITFEALVYTPSGTTTDTISFNFTKDGGSLGNLANFSASVTANTIGTLVSFNRTYAAPGTLDARVFVNLSGSFPDYVIPGTSTQTDSRTFDFNVNVINPVPEPASVGLVACGLACCGIFGWRRRSEVHVNKT